MDGENDISSTEVGTQNNDCNNDEKSPTNSSECGSVENPQITQNENHDYTAKNEKRRKIRWAKRVRIKEIRHVNDISDSEKAAIWMSVDDYQMAKQMVKTTVFMMMRGEHIPEDDLDFCTRGLEFRTRAGSKMRSQYKLRARSAVLNEQDLQRDEGFFDQQFIAMASMDESFECREGARLRAVYDAKCIETYLDDVRQGIRGMNL